MNEIKKSGCGFLVAALVFAAPIGYAADNETETSTDTFKNPITGTVTTTERVHKKSTDRVGNKNEYTTTARTKVKTDGDVEKKVETEQKSEATR